MKSFIVTEIIIFNKKSCFSIPILFSSVSILPYRKRKLVLPKAHFVFKKSKERYLFYKPQKVVYLTPFFTCLNLIELFLGSILPYFCSMSYSSQVKLKLHFGFSKLVQSLFLIPSSLVVKADNC